MLRRLGIGWLVWPTIAAIVVFIGLSGPTSRVALADPAASLTVSPSSQIVALGGNFTITVKIDTDDATFAGYQDSVIFDQTKLQAVSVVQNVNNPLSTCGPTSFDNVGPPGQTYDNGCVSLSGPPPGTPPTGDPLPWVGKVATTITMSCGQVEGTYALTLAPAADPNLASTLLDTNGGNINTTLNSGTVTCALPSDVSITSTHTPEPMLVGIPGAKYTLTVTNNGPQVARGVVAVDVVPADKEVQGIVTCPGPAPICSEVGAGKYIVPLTMGGTVDGGVDADNDGDADAPCAWYAAYPNLYPPPATLNNVVACYIAGASQVGGNSAVFPFMAPGQVVHVIVPVVATAPLTVVNIAQVPDCPVGLPGSAHSMRLLGTTCPLLGGAIPEPNPTYDTTLSNNLATDVTTEVPPVILEGYDKGISAEPATLWLAPGTYDKSVVSEVIYVVDAGANPNIVHTWTATPSSASLTVGWDSQPWAAPGAPDVITWTSSGHTDGEEFTAQQNLYVLCSGDSGGTVDIVAHMMAGNDPADSVTSLNVNCMTGKIEKVPSGPINLWLCEGPNCSDKNGLIAGRGELDIDEVVSGISGDPLGAGAFEFTVLYDSSILDLSVVPTGWLASTGRTVDCTPTIVNENSITVACVSSDQGTLGPKAAGTIAKITVVPDPDVVAQDMTPGQDNGIVTVISDQGCEVANIMGDPILGALQNGRVGGCNFVTVTIRILEADLNLDCAVNVLDEQAIAFRYGASFGMLLYSPWFDLQPALKDNDIDIKDVQKVFGRDGSTCAAPIPPQPPQ